MKKISNKDSMRILAHLQKARNILETIKEKSDDGEVYTDKSIAIDCIGYIDEILIMLNNTILE